MSDKITIREATGTWVVRAGGAVLGETTRALALDEDGHATVIYFPRGDIAMAFLDRTETSTHCPKKGDATYYSIVSESTTIRDAAWSYEDPIPQAEAIRGHLAFHTGDLIAVEEV